MKENMIEKYYVEGGWPKVVMSQETARDIYFATLAYEAASEGPDTYIDKAEMGIWFAKKFLDDEEAKQYLSLNERSNPTWLKYQVFYDAMKKKAKELLNLT